MAQSDYIQSVLDAAKGRPYSTSWYREKIKEFGTPGAVSYTHLRAHETLRLSRMPSSA